MKVARSEKYSSPNAPRVTGVQQFQCVGSARASHQMSRLVDAWHVVVTMPMVKYVPYGVAVLVLGLEWLWQRMPCIVAVAAMASLTYHGAALAFGYGWGEGTTDVGLHLLQGGLSKAMGWLVWAYFAHSLLYPDDDADADNNFGGTASSSSTSDVVMTSPKHSNVVAAALTVFVGAVTWLLWDAQVQDTRVSIVQGGPEPPWLQLAPVAAAAAPQVKRPQQPNDTSNGPVDAPRNGESLQGNSMPQPKRNQQTLVILITGANTGIGYETLAHIGAQSSSQPWPFASETIVFLLCRSVEKGRAAWHKMVQRPGGFDTASSSGTTGHVIACDLTSYSSIRNAVRQVLRLQPRIDVLINNAGVLLPTLSYTETDGHESCLQANFLGPFVLTKLVLLSRMQHDESSRPDGAVQNETGAAKEDQPPQPQEQQRPLIVINVTSSTYRLALDTFDATDLDALQCRRGNNKRHRFSLFGQYAATKWCNILHTVFLSDHFANRRHSSIATTTTTTTATRKQPWVLSFAVHPGLVRTDVVRYMPWYLKVPNTVFAALLQTLQKTPSQGAWCTMQVLLQALHETSSMDTADTIRDQRDDYYWVNRRPQALLPQLSTVREQARLVWEWALVQGGLTALEVQQIQSLTGSGSSTTTTTG
jgi:NAD(P)-dependent dehydrogenase (short-subunit alcohol dehydrogenase family)